MADGWKNRIVGTDVRPASSFLANEQNWRIHPKNQQDALLGNLSEVGWVQDVIVNLRSDPSWGADRGVETLIDGHLRVSLALREGDETPIPVKYLDLLPAEENIILSSFDPIASLALADKAKLDALLRDTKPADAALQQFLSELAAKEGLYTGENGANVLPPEDFKEYGEDIETQYCCPKCGYEWAGQPK